MVLCPDLVMRISVSSVYCTVCKTCAIVVWLCYIVLTMTLQQCNFYHLRNRNIMAKGLVAVASSRNYQLKFADHIL